MGRVLFKLDPVPDPLEEITAPITEAPVETDVETAVETPVEAVVETPVETPVDQEPIPPVSGGRVLFQIEPEAETEPTITETIGRGLKGEAELGAAVVSGVLLEPIAGIAGLIASTPFFKEGAAAETVEFVRGLAFKPGPAGQEIAKGIGEIAETLTPDIIIELGSTVKEEFIETQEEVFENYGAAAATAFGLIPPALLETTAGYATIKQMRKLTTTRADEAIQNTEDALRDKETTTFRTDIQPEDKTLKQISDDFGKQNTENIIDAIKPDAEILQSAKDLGIDLNPSHFSTNQAFVQMEQGLKSRPDSRLADIEGKAIKKLGDQADKLILDMEGAVEKGLLDQAVKNKFQKTISDLEIQASKAYSKVNEKIPRALPVIPKTSRLYIEGRLEDLGGDVGLLSRSEKQLARILGIPKKEPVVPGLEEVELPTPSYGAIDQIRRNVGNALEKKSGPYKDDEELILDQVYGVLANDQQGVADAFGIGPVYEQGRKLVRLRKDIEKKSLDLFGREVKGSLIPKLSTAAANITKGDISNFNKLMNALPVAQKQAAAATMLNDFFVANARKGGALGGGFVGAFEALNRNPSIKKIVFDQLPKEALKRFDDLGRVTTGIFRAKALQNNSGTANAILANLDNGGIAQKILRSRRLASPFSKFGRALSFSAEFLRKTLPKKTEIASDLLTSPAFRKSLEEAALGNAVSAEKIINTKTFKSWLKEQTLPDQRQIASIGFIPWLLQEEVEEEVDIEVTTEQLRRRNQ